MTTSTTYFFNKSEEEEIIKAIQKAEQNTSGEIRLHIQQKCRYDDPYKEAKYIFQKLKMYKTAQRNAVLFFFSPNERKIAIYGDEGINNIVPKNFWNDIIHNMIEQFKENKFLDAFKQAIEKCGEKLNVYFPYQIDDKNELSNEISNE